MNTVSKEGHVKSALYSETLFLLLQLTNENQYRLQDLTLHYSQYLIANAVRSSKKLPYKILCVKIKPGDKATLKDDLFD